MIPTLYEATATSFNDNGLGALPELYDAEVIEKANDILELTATYPVSGRRYDDLIEDAIILAKPNSRDDEHAFRISDLELDIAGENVAITAYSITNDLGSNLITDLAISDADGQTAMTNLQNAVQSDTHFKFASDITTKSSTHFQMVSPLEAIAGTTGSLLQIWGGEIKRENDRISLLARRGYDDVTTFRLGKNISGLKYAIDTSSVVTRIYPYYSKTVDGGTSLIRGATVDSKYIGNYPYVHIKPVDVSQEITVTEDMTDEQIVAAIDGWAKDWFTKSANTGVDKPSVTISLDVLELSGSSELEGKLATLEQLGLFDTVTLFVPEYNIDVTAKVNELHYDPMARRVTSLVAGTVKTSVFSQQSTALSIVQAAVAEAKNQADYAAVSANGKNTNFFGDAEPFNPKDGDIWYTTELIDGKKEDVTKTFTNGVWTELVASATGRQVAHDVDAKLVQLNADMSVADANLQVAQQDIDDLQVKLKSNDDTQAQLKNDLSANSTILAQAQADIVANTQSLSDLDTKLKANDETQAQLQTDLAANTKVQAQLTTDLAANSQLVTQNKADVDAALKSVNETLTQAQTDTAAAVKNADLAVTTAQSAVDASGLATTTANAANDAATAAKNLATSTANSFVTVQSQAATAVSDAADAISAANKAQGDATSALGNSNTAISNAKDALNKINSISVGGTNLLRNSRGKFQPNKSVTDNWDAYGSVGTAVYMEQGQQYTVHADASSGLVWSGMHNISVESNNVVLWLVDNAKVNTIISDSNTGTGTTFTWYNPSGTYYLRVNTYKPDNSGYVENVKIEKGNVATDWSPAPEDVQVQISNINGELSQKVSQTDYDNLKGTVTSQGTLIDQNSKAIELKANQSTVDTLSGEVSDNTSKLKLTATAASLEVTSKKVDTLSQTVTDQGAKLDLTATSAQLKVTENKVDALNQTVSDNSAQLKLTATSAALETQSNRVDTISGKVDTNTAAITAANGEIELKASNSRVDTLSNTVKQQGIDLKAAQGELKLKLTQSDLTKGLDGYATQTWAQNQITATATELSSTMTTVQTQVQNSAVGTNLLRNSAKLPYSGNQNSSWSTGQWRIAGNTTDTDDMKRTSKEITDPPQGDKATVISCTGILRSSINDISLVAINSIPISGNVAVSFWARQTSSVDTAFVSASWGAKVTANTNASTEKWNSTVYRKLFLPKDGSWTRFWGTFWANNNENLYIGAGNTGTSAEVQICLVKLEKGSLATDWSPNPADNASVTALSSLSQTVDGLTGTFAKKTDLEDAKSNFKVTADGLNLITDVTGKNGEKVTQVIADVKKIQTTMTGADGYTTRLQTLEGFQSTASSNITNLQTQQTTLAGQYTSLIESADNKVRKPWFDDDQTGTWAGANAIVGGPDSNVQKLTGHSKYLRLLGRDNYEGGVGWFSVTPGEVYYFSGYMGSWGTTYAVNVGLHFITEDGTNSWLKATGFPANSKTPMSAITGSITVPAGIVRAKTWVQIDAYGADLGYVSISGLRISKSASNSQITQLQNQIDLRTTVAGKVTAALNLSNDGGGTVTIRGASLYVTAASHFDDASIQSAAIASLDAKKITSGSISSDRLATTKLNADNITSGSIAAERLATTKLNADNITSGSINAELITTGKLSADRIWGGIFDASKMTVKNIDAGSITSGSIATALLASTKINADNITSGSIAAERLAATKISATNIVGGTFDAGTMTVKRLSADMIATGTLDVSKLTAVKNFSASNIIGGTLDASTMTVKKLSASSITGGTINGANVNVIGLNASAITTGTISGANLAINLNSGQVVFQSGRIHDISNSIDINVDDGYISVANGNSRVMMKNGIIQFVEPTLFDQETTPYLNITNQGGGNSLYTGAGFIGRDYAYLTNSANNGDMFSWPMGVENFSGIATGKSSSGWQPTTVGGANRGVVIVGGTEVADDKGGTTATSSPYITVGSTTNGKAGGNRIYLYAEYLHVPTTYYHTGSGSANVMVKSDGALVRTSSATKYKSNIERFRNTDMGEALLNLPQAHWYNKQDMQRYADDPQHYSMPELDYGMIAEDLAAAGLEDLVVRGDDGQLEDIRYDRIAPALLPLLAKMKQEIEELKGEKTA